MKLNGIFLPGRYHLFLGDLWNKDSPLCRGVRNGLGRLLGKDSLEIDPDVARRGGMEAQQMRAAANAPIKGSSADIIQVAMLQRQVELHHRVFPSQQLLQVLDELVLEMSPDALEAIKSLVAETESKSN